jgi:hypothetical protein
MSRGHRSGRWVRITLNALFAIHGDRCGRCLAPIDRRLSGLHPLGATIGHRIALADGGTDHLENLRPEHRICNLRAGRRDVPIATEPEPRARLVTP